MLPFSGEYPEWMAQVSPRDCEYHLRSGFTKDAECGHYLAGVSVICIHKESGNQYTHSLVSNDGFETQAEAIDFAEMWAKSIINLLAVFGFVNNVAGPFTLN